MIQAIRKLKINVSVRVPWFALLLGAFICINILGHGIPALRHDWFFPADTARLSFFIRWLADGWTSFGFGSPQPYPTFYPLVSILWPLSLILPASGVLAAIILLTIALAAESAAAIGRHVGSSVIGCYALALLAALNPWVYTEYVAGHIFMVTAYAMLLALVAEVTRPAPRDTRLCMIAAFSVMQIEFLLLLVIPFTVWCLRHHKQKALGILGIFSTPIIVGIIANYSWIRSTPHGLDWAIGASVPIQLGAMLTGYEMPYAAAFSSITFASAVLAFLSLVGLWKSRGMIRVLIWLSVILLCYASGSHDFFAPVFRWIVVSIPESGVFRELYDLIAFVAVGSVLALATTYAEYRFLAWVGLGCAVALVIPWVQTPVATMCVSASEFPHTRLPLELNSRVLLLPAFQPLSYRHRGSGTDPDIFPREGGATPLNEWFPSYPVDVALGYANHQQHPEYAQALGATMRIERPYFTSDQRTLSNQGMQLGQSPTIRQQKRVLLPTAMPLLSVQEGLPHLTSVGDNPAEFSEAFADRYPSRIWRLTPSASTHDSSKAWVDARMSVATWPESGSAFGAVTTTSQVLLPLPAVRAVLALIDGSLLDSQGRVIAKNSAQYHWWPLSNKISALRCFGRCTIALTARTLPDFVEHYYPVHQQRALHIQQLTPWLGIALLPPHSEVTLRYNVRFDPSWAAYSEYKELHHLRIDTAINAWTLSPTDQAQRIVIIHRTAIVQAMLEISAFVVLVIVMSRRRGYLSCTERLSL